jgi:recombination protein RecA
VVKNKVAPPFRKVELELMFGKGISAIGSLLDAAVKYEIIDKKGAWFAYGEEKIGQGRDNAKEFLAANPQLVSDLEGRLRAIMFPGRTAPPARSPAAPAAAVPPARSPAAPVLPVQGAANQNAAPVMPAADAPVQAAVPPQSAVNQNAAPPQSAVPPQGPVMPAVQNPAMPAAAPRGTPAGNPGIELKNEEPRHRGRPPGSKNKVSSPEDLF